MKFNITMIGLLLLGISFFAYFALPQTLIARYAETATWFYDWQGVEATSLQSGYNELRFVDAGNQQWSAQQNLSRKGNNLFLLTSSGSGGYPNWASQKVRLPLDLNTINSFKLSGIMDVEGGSSDNPACLSNFYARIIETDAPEKPFTTVGAVNGDLNDIYYVSGELPILGVGRDSILSNKNTGEKYPDTPSVRHGTGKLNDIYFTRGNDYWSLKTSDGLTDQVAVSAINLARHHFLELRYFTGSEITSCSGTVSTEFTNYEQSPALIVPTPVVTPENPTPVIVPNNPITPPTGVNLLPPQYQTPTYEKLPIPKDVKSLTGFVNGTYGIIAIIGILAVIIGYVRKK